MTSISTPILPTLAAPTRRVRRTFAAVLVVAAVFVPASSAAAFVAPRAVHAVEVFAGDLTRPHHLSGPAASAR